ncbi:hypothetical protein [Microbacterium sp. PMB16]|uniref:hypothetical protein n=1 Tax=Microbacterium sp. PMB16 TaxID=3120157 RepID=UPI003F4C4140
MRVVGDRDRLRFEIGPRDGLSASMRRVDIHAAGTHVTAADNSVYVPDFTFRLNRTLKSFARGTRFEQRRDAFGDLGPRDIHMILADGSDRFPDAGRLSDLWSFLEFGGTTLHALGFLIPTRGGVYVTCETSVHRGAKSRDIRTAEVSVEEITETLAETLDFVSAGFTAQERR